MAALDIKVLLDGDESDPSLDEFVDANGSDYTSQRGKSGRIKSLGKE